LRRDSLLEQVQRRYQTDLDTFQPEWEPFLKSLKEQRSRLKAAMETEPADGAANVGDLREEDWELAKVIVNEMSERLDGMGPVNLESIQEYEELEERQRFLEGQHNDLIKAKAELLDIINQINATTEHLFAETFEQVRKNFQEMFGELFGGGKANLLLVDDADPLETGIEIIAKPPGKQLQSISLLSGGEKTMTAVALLFSIYMVKPSPFCVLDEMDAPLDESNINRFIKILDRFVHQSQFVVITHNKRTIAKADVLYGVTMEEHGISKLVGVRLTKREEPELVAASATTEDVPVNAGTEEANQVGI
jgi:chromosome segregation protein